MRIVERKSTMEQHGMRVRASRIGGSAPKRPRGYTRPLVKLMIGNSQTTWLFMPKGLVTNSSKKSDYTYWLERVVRTLGVHADEQGKKVITLRNKLATSRKEYRELAKRLNEAPAGQLSLTQADVDKLERDNLDLRKTNEELEQALKECRSNVSLIQVSKGEKQENLEARIREPYKQAAAANERRINELEARIRELEAQLEEASIRATNERRGRLRAERRARIAGNNMQFLLSVNDTVPIDDFTQTLPENDHDEAVLIVTTADMLKLVYSQRPNGKCFVRCLSLRDAEEQIRQQQIELDETGQLSDAQLRFLDQLCDAVTHEGKEELRREIGATKQYTQLYGTS